MVMEYRHERFVCKRVGQLVCWKVGKEKPDFYKLEGDAPAVTRRKAPWSNLEDEFHGVTHGQ